ncbi:hypothetical protein FIV37_22480 [Pseudomonas gessardii]|nr:hypothetical protein [Pseudomonas gessardii]ONH38879.1 hypothetical protein BLL38_21835 [Pseudomonas gessardii]
MPGKLQLAAAARQVDRSIPKFIYDFSYNKALMDGVKKNSNQAVSLVINQAFWPALMINQ